MKQLYQQGFDYRKAGVMLRDLSPAALGQKVLFGESAGAVSGERRAQLNIVLDQINQKWGRGAAKLLVETGSLHWQMAHNNLSPAYTTDWRELPTAH